MSTIVRVTGWVSVGLAALALATTACGESEPSADRSTTTTSTRAVTSTTTILTATTTTSPSTTASPTSAPPTSAPTTSQLGPEWRQQDGRVLIEAVASGDAQQLLADLVALGLTDGVVVGRLVNGWLPVESFDAAQRLDTVQFIQPTGAGTGAGG